MPELAKFEGRWSLDRSIEDRRAGQTGQFEGDAVFGAAPDGLIYREAGLLKLGQGPAMRAERRYVWREAGGGIAVAFEDGRPFHRFSDTSPEDVHLCGSDRYEVAYDFSGWPRWTATWTVSGPAKDYTMTSRYMR
ncbi:DUF6314 family protein [Tropicimonas sp. IMCC34011]|uniref:DUF6314 family protein n=1 Tax=Tropicimonas sp. IMCC34011 TaxID=2248759 RepID=UPI000E2368BF|nr:DUF6314 family protein [Tropicimonas sp. IMCC34011]